MMLYMLTLIWVWSWEGLEVGAPNVQGVGLNGTLTVGYAVPWSHEWEVGPTMGSAIVVGLEEVERRQLLPGYAVEWVWRDTWCKPQRGMQMAVDMWASVDDLDAIIGEGCSVVCQPISLLAAAWGIPVVSYGCASSLLSDKVQYPTFTRTVGPWTGFAPMFNAVVTLFGWDRVGIITTNEDVMRLTAQATASELENSGKTVFYHLIETTVSGNVVNEENLQKQQEIVRSLKQEARIIIMISYANDMRNLLLSALDEGMLDGTYVFLCLDCAYLKDTTFPYRPEADSLIYTGLITIQYRKNSGPEYDEFARQVIEAFDDPRFDGLPHLPITADPSEVEPYAGFVHDSVLQWAYGVNRTLAEGYSPDDGFRVTQNIFNLTFQGITGKVLVNDLGDRMPDQRFEIIQNDSLVPILDWFAADEDLVKIYKPNDPDDWSGLIWHGNNTNHPTGQPECGWLFEFCGGQSGAGPSQVFALVMSLLGALSLVSLFAGGIFMARYKLNESKLREAGLLTVRWTDVEIHQATMPDNIDPHNSVMAQKLDTKEDANQIGTYQGQSVVVKPIVNTIIDIKDRQVLSELKDMREITHQNLLPLIGICCEAPNTCVLVEHSHRGSIQDIIAGQDTNLTWDFKISIILDIAAGLRYLHQSNISYHGRLTSAKCIVDNKWICKITGYGLRHVTSHSNKYKDTSPEKLQWCAPEILRQEEPSQKSDIYSFGIITKEVLLEEMPYASNDDDLDFKTIIENVKRPISPVYRPVILDGACSSDWENFMSQCWQESPRQRPAITDVLRTLRILNKGRSMNLVDSIIKRLEFHTEKLEEHVAERTKDIIAEKGKMEILLSQLLPASVAARLTQGMTIQPESFDCVSIMFSDIVGFTRISSQSTPLQTVMMLNNMYTVFDDVILNYDVYKVATIGDAYMVASGVPDKNGSRHASEICKMAQELLSFIENFTISHIENERLQLRLGVHSGPCVAGVAGIKMPRYMLFGDTVFIAEKMESNSKPLKILVSNATVEVLNQDATSKFALSENGPVNLKGKGTINSFWLNEQG